MFLKRLILWEPVLKPDPAMETHCLFHPGTEQRRVMKTCPPHIVLAKENDYKIS